MKKTLIWVTVLLLLMMMGVSSAVTMAVAEEGVLFERVHMLLEEGEESLGYDGLGLPVGMDDMDLPAGLVMVEMEVGKGTIQVSCGRERWIWDFMEKSDCVNALLVICSRWEKLTSGTDEQMMVAYCVDTSEKGDFFVLTSAEDAKEFLKGVFAESDD